MKKLILKSYCILFLIASLPGCAGAKSAKVSADNFGSITSISQTVSTMCRRANAGVIVQSLDNGKVLYSHNSTQLFTPASNMKVVTSFAALKYLGPNFTFDTRFLTDAVSTTPVNGTLNGNLYIKFTGDPNLNLQDLDSMVDKLVDQGIHSIHGNLIIDTSFFDKQGISPGTVDSDQNYCYGAPVEAAIINRNCVSFRLVPGTKVGQPVKINFPYDIQLPIENHAITSNNYACRLSLKSGDANYQLNGCLTPRNRGLSFTIPIPQESLFGQQTILALLKRHQISIQGNNLALANNDSQLKVVASHQSPPLSKLVFDMMKRSDNLIANALFKTLGARYNSQPGTWQNSGTAVKAILQQNGIDTSGMVIIDGSGLSRYDRITPTQLLEVLVAAYHDKNIASIYMNALPVGGLNGTLKNRLGTRDIIGKVKAKTGSMKGVSSLSGYVEARSGEMLVFSIIVNDFNGGLYPYRAMEDKICRYIRLTY